MSKSWWNYLFWWCPLTHSCMLYTFHHRTFYIKQQSTHQSHFYSIVSDLCIYKAPIFRPQLKIFLYLIPIEVFFCGCIKLENNKKIGFSYCTIPTLLDHLDRQRVFVSDETFQTFGDIISTSRKCRIWEHNITRTRRKEVK